MVLNLDLLEILKVGKRIEIGESIEVASILIENKILLDDFFETLIHNHEDGKVI